MNKPVITMFFLIAVIGCKEKTEIAPSNSLRDSIIKEYFMYTKSLKSYDTTEYNYKVFKAYYFNDTPFLKEIQKHIIQVNEYEKERKATDTCRIDPNIDTMTVEEAYQFSYSEAFCPYKTTFTIALKQKQANLQTIIYKYDRIENKCGIVKKYSTKLNIQQWQSLISALDFADYWGLKQVEEQIVLDGDHLSIEGIERNIFSHEIRKKHFFGRQAVSGTAIYKAYLLVLEFSGNKEGCFKF